MQNSSAMLLKKLVRDWLTSFLGPSHFCKTDTREATGRAFFCSKDGPKEEPVVVAEKRTPVYNMFMPDLTDRGICAVDPCDAEKCYRQPRVVIIGAGMAGISAAARLTMRNLTNFVVLEACNRPGGRILSSFIGDVVAELGAYWRPDLDYNISPVYSMIANEDPPRPGPPAAEHPRGLFTRAFGEQIPLAPTVAAYNKFRQIEEEAMSIYCHGGSKQHGSLVDFISLRIQQELHEFPAHQQHDAARIMFGLAHMLNARCGYDTQSLCCDNLGCYMKMPGGDVHVPLGNIGMLAPFMRDLPEGCIRYCKPVTTVYWGTCTRQGHRAIVICADGEEFPCDYVIVTVSLGVLMMNASRLFCPELPGAKMEAMHCLGYGHCNKIYMEYCRPFWYWQQAELNLKFCGGCGRSDWTNGVTTIEVMPHSKYVLCAWVVGNEARMMEELCDRDVAEGLTDMLRWATSTDNVPYPSSILRSHWSIDPFFCGAHSFETCCADGGAQRALSCPVPGPSEPVPPILLFAGEATVPGHFATVSGARLSGIREAERVISLTRQYQGPPTISLNFPNIEMNVSNECDCEAAN